MPMLIYDKSRKVDGRVGGWEVGVQRWPPPPRERP